ncbi:hypothetical protein [Nostoc sp.]|uniref:hypothetical protein n=1 Tax=Nostoc sp. TaxID=1180 RepID=UPI002FFC34D5
MNKLPSRHKKATSAASVEPKPATDSTPENISAQHKAASATIEVVAVEVLELTPEEQSLRLNLERRVERAFLEAGQALMELRDGLTPRRRRSQIVPFHAPDFRGVLPRSPLALAKPSLQL